jgi:hypothetical protein
VAYIIDMKMTFEQYWELQDQLFKIKIVEKDDKLKQDFIDLKKELSNAFKKAYPKGFNAKEYKAHKKGQTLIAISYDFTQIEDALIDQAKEHKVEPLVEVEVEVE